LLLWAAITELPPPTFAHVPILVNEARQKLSKRRDKVALEQYRDEGFLAEAMRNFLMLLGWAPSNNREKVDFTEVVMAEFRLDDVNSSPAFFDLKKLTNLNGEYIRELPVSEFVALVAPYLDQAPWPADRFRSDWFESMAPLVQERTFRLDEVVPMIDFLFLADPVIDEGSWTKTMKDNAGAMIDGVMAGADAIEWNPDALKVLVESVGTSLGLKLGKAQAPVRVAITGRTVGPPLFEPMALLGRDECVRRLQAARARI
jgi:glutamyl-tRNA synthetase